LNVAGGSTTAPAAAAAAAATAAPTSPTTRSSSITPAAAETKMSAEEQAEKDVYNARQKRLSKEFGVASKYKYLKGKELLCVIQCTTNGEFAVSFMRLVPHLCVFSRRR
jgi:hypothetical protein